MKKLIATLLVLSLAGCAARAEPPAPAAEEPSPVYTDWSKLTPYEPLREVYTYHAGYRVDGGFEPRGDYGVLLPYIGKYSAMEQYVIDALPFYGLVTDKGELVSEPVYAGINFYDGFLMLYRGDPEGAGGGDTYAGGRFARTLAASDGRWAHELTDSYYAASGFGLLLTAAQDGSLALWNADGEVVMRFDGARFEPFLGEGFVWGREGGPFIELVDDKVGYVRSYLVNGEYRENAVCLYLDLADGAVLTEPPAGYPREIDYEALEAAYPEPPAVEGCNYLDRILDPITGETYYYGYYCDGGEENGSFALFDGAGTLLVDNADLSRFEASITVRGGLCSTIEDGFFCYRALADNELAFRRFMRTNSD